MNTSPKKVLTPYHWLGFLILLFGALLFTISETTPSMPTQSSPSTPSAVILMYHHFGENALPTTSVRLAQFEAQLDYLAAENFTVWPLSKLVKAIQNKTPIPPKTVVLTIDDA